MDFKDLVIQLDMVLTEHDRLAAEQMWRNQTEMQTPEKFVTYSDTYYLSDGGYSRVAWSELYGYLFYTSNSTDKVKENWEKSEAQAVIKKLENVLRSVYGEQWKFMTKEETE